MIAIQPRTATRASLRIWGGIKLAQILALSEDAFEDHVRRAESAPLFRRLREEGVLSVQPLARGRFMTRALQGCQLRSTDDGVAELLDGRGEIAALIKRVGQENFEACFIAKDRISDVERARECGISLPEARMLRDFMDRLYVRSEFQETERQAPPVTVYSSVAGVSVADGRPVLGFFNRDVWKGRYQTDEARYQDLKASLTTREAARIERFMRQVDALAFRQTTLFRLLEYLIEKQADYLASGDPARRTATTQREVAAALQVSPVALYYLIGNKSIEAPWRLEIPLKTLLPSRKAMLRGRLYDLAIERPNAGDDCLREELRRRYGSTISRPSIIQYRKELGLGGCGRRGAGDSYL